MLLDAQNLFSEKQDITTGTIYSTNVVNFGKNDISFVPVVIQAVEDFSSLTSLSVLIQTSDNAEFSNPVDLAQSKLELAELKAGAKFPITYLPKGNKGFIRLAYVVDGSETTGKITAGAVASNELSYHEM